MAASSHKYTDQQIVRGINNGDKIAFEWLFFEYYSQLCISAYQIVKSEEAAKDVVQNIFLKLWQSHKKLKIKTSLKAYLYRAVKNQAINHNKKEQNQERLARNYSAETGTNFEEPAIQTATSKLKVTSQIWEIVNKMPERRKHVFKYHRRHGLSYKEISQVMDISRKTVENHMGLALKDLRDEMK